MAIVHAEACSQVAASVEPPAAPPANGASISASSPARLSISGVHASGRAPARAVTQWTRQAIPESAALQVTTSSRVPFAVASPRFEPRRRAIPPPGGNACEGNAASQQAMLQILARLQAMSDELQVRCKLRAAARRAWCGQDPAPAELPCWPEDSAGDRFFSGMMLDEAMKAPCLATAVMPDARVIAAEPARWNVALSVLVRAVLLDGVPVDDPKVQAILGVLAPVAEAEYYRQAASLAAFRIGTAGVGDEPEFPEQDGPMSLLGTCGLVDAPSCSRTSSPASPGRPAARVVPSMAGRPGPGGSGRGGSEPDRVPGAPGVGCPEQLGPGLARAAGHDPACRPAQVGQ
jgi:hypothetical protein